MGSLDLPDQPDEPRKAEHADTGGPDWLTPKSREMPDPDERGRIYEAMRAYVSAETGELAEAGSDEQGPAAGERPEGTEERSYWADVPRFLDMRADLKKRWPTDRQRREDLPPEQQVDAAEAIGRMRESEPGISADVRTTEQESRYGGWLEGFGCRLKGEDRLKEKIAELLKAEPRMTAHEALREIPDGIRYTFCFESGSYARGYYEIKERLESRGYETYLSNNSWSSQEYKGINTRWVTQDGQRFEVQFHTPESFHAKQHVTHTAYERIRNPMISDRERIELRDFQREVSSAIPIPDGATEIPNYKKEGF